MNSHDTLIAVMNVVQDLREHDRQVGQDSSREELDKIPNAVNQALKNHGGYITHEVLTLHQSARTDQDGRSRAHAFGVVSFSIFGSEEGNPVTSEVPAEAWGREGDPVPRFMKNALWTFYQTTFLLPTDGAEPDSFSYDFGPPSIPKSNDVEAQEVNLTLDEYASKVVKYYMEMFQSYRGSYFKTEIIELLILEGFTLSQAEFGASQNGF
jgi:hypothetical protein